MRALSIALLAFIAPTGAGLIEAAREQIIPETATVDALLLWVSAISILTLIYAIAAVTHTRRIGGIRFIRCGCAQISFCISGK